MTETDDRLRYWLALWYAPRVGAATFHALLEQCNDPVRLFQQPDARDESLPAQLRGYLRHPDWERVDKDLAWQESDTANHILTTRSAAYPPLLKELRDAPPVLFVHGNPDVLGLHQLAIVGSRNPSTSGEHNAQDFAAHLAASGLAITSGLALGIDAAGHRGALQARGTSIAVLGTGPDRVYPARHRDLAHEIAGAGALVTELPPGTGPRPENFPRRNRIISALSLGTLVVEAAPRSGSLITAQCALEQGREVFAVPGSIHNPLARGCHQLIRQGAKLVETAEDILEELGSLALASHEPGASAPDNAPEPDPELNEDHAQLLDLIGHDPVAVDLLVDRSGLTAESISSMLLILELRGYVESAPGGRYARIDKRL